MEDAPPKSDCDYVKLDSPRSEVDSLRGKTGGFLILSLSHVVFYGDAFEKTMCLSVLVFYSTVEGLVGISLSGEGDMFLAGVDIRFGLA